jgi:hypothetical protein
VSAQTDRNRCEFAKASVKFRNVTEEQENRRRRKEHWLYKKNKSDSPLSGGMNGSQAAYLKP